MTVAVCSHCGARIALSSRLALDGDCEECGAEEALVEEDAYDAEPSTLRCCDCGAEVQGGPASSTSHDEDRDGRYTVDDPCPFCATADGAGELIPANEWTPLVAAPQARVARAAALKLWREHGSRVPADVLAIAQAAGLEVRIGAFKHSGRLRDRTIIEVPEHDLPVRQRFTIAHELGHATLAHQVPEQALEVEANAFAAELLLPTPALRQAVKDGMGFKEIAAHFQASREATAIALKDARLLPSVTNGS
jgi:IrrE N-terminal-like domain